MPLQTSQDGKRASFLIFDCAAAASQQMRLDPLRLC
jgi:hypothetical protein